MKPSLAFRFTEQLEALESDAGSERGSGVSRDVGGPLVVAASGGLDSCVLLHLLRFAAPRREILAAHFDHGMRAGSASDAQWLSGLCRAWDIPCVLGVADVAPESEEGARVMRYGFLEATAREAHACAVLTAHHADDQAETVLFRVLRGTGLTGLQGIPVRREPGIFRPLLPFWREELEAYAKAEGLSWRDDPTNVQLGYARNVLRHEVLPLVEDAVAPGARRALVRLAEVAADDERAWAAVMPDVMTRLAAAPTKRGGHAFDHSAFLALDRSLRVKVLRHVAGALGRVPDRALTQLAVTFASKSRSGTRFGFGQGIEIRRELDRVVVEPASSVAADEPLDIGDVAPGSGGAVVGGRALNVTWESGPASPGVRLGAEIEEGGSESEGVHHACFPVAELDFPLTLRSRRPGDRIRLRGGSRKVKKVLLDFRIPPEDRERVPLLVDAKGRVLWVAGVVRTSELSSAQDGRTMLIRIRG